MHSTLCIFNNVQLIKLINKLFKIELHLLITYSMETFSKQITVSGIQPISLKIAIILA